MHYLSNSKQVNPRNWSAKDKLLDLRTKSNKTSSVLIILVLAVSTLLFNYPSSAQTSDTEDWTFIQEVEKVKFYYQKSNCNTQDFLLLKIVNENNNEIHGSWRLLVQDGTSKHKFMGVFMEMKAGVAKMGLCSKPEANLMIPNQFKTTTPQFSIEVNFSHQ
jgi:hypothetical protein